MKKKTTIHSFTLLALFLVFSFTAVAQNGTIKGIVKDDKGQAIADASVTIAGKNNGVITDQNGNYSINIPTGKYNVIASYVGTSPQQQKVEVKANETIEINFSLKLGQELTDVIVVGSRSNNARSSTQTAVPIDVISSRELLLTGNVEPTQMISVVAPSFNSSRQTLADGSDHIDPATLRGLEPDQVLVLVNGKRRYSTALINLNGTIGKGSVGTDLNAIPASAIERVEVLRDGASSQYGSDAIAGVINVILKQSAGTQITSQFGQQYKGDGQVGQIGISHGFKFSNIGDYLTLNADVRYRGATNRAGDYSGPVYKNWAVSRNTNESDADFITRKTDLYNQDQALIAQNNFSRSKTINFGNSELKSFGFDLNGGNALNSNIFIYYNAGTSYRNGNAGGLYRYPYQSSQNISDIYPDGFLPHILSDVWDKNAQAGVKFSTNGWNWDISNTFGGNSFKYNVENSLNASQYVLGANAPTSFYSGKIKFNQNIVNADVSKDLHEQLNAFKSFNVAFGGEYRVENYGIEAGDVASYTNYDPQSGKAGGAQVFPGFQPSNEVDAYRHIGAAYADIESDINDRLLINTAVRVENYSDYGSSVAGKFATRYKITDYLSIRGDINNGFRAPSLQQRNYSSVSTVFVNVNGVLTPRQVGTFRNNSDVAKAFGIPSLKAETSLNGSLGFTVKAGQFSLTADAYAITIHDRIVLTGQFSRSNTTVNTLLTDYPDVNAVQFFTNAINTETQGVDVVTAYKFQWQNKQSLNISLAGNYNETHIFGKVAGTDKIPADQFENTLFNRQERGRIEKGQPRSKITFSTNYQWNKFGTVLRFTRYGEVQSLNASNPLLDEKYSAKTLTDISFSYQATKAIQVTVGANNVFDVYPDKIKNTKSLSPYTADAALDNTSYGRMPYGRDAIQFGFNGGYYYLTLGLKF
jgi:iron complex outermembrane receptor protein